MKTIKIERLPSEIASLYGVKRQPVLLERKGEPVGVVHRFGSSPTKGRRIASASGSSHRQLHDGGYPPFLPFQPVFGTNTG